MRLRKFWASLSIQDGYQASAGGAPMSGSPLIGTTLPATAPAKGFTVAKSDLRKHHLALVL